MNRQADAIIVESEGDAFASSWLGAQHLENRDTIALALIRRDGKIVLVREQGPDDSEPFWALPGGRSERGELLTETLAREVREETGLKVTSVADLVYVGQMHNPRLLSRSPGELPPPDGTATVFVFNAKARQAAPLKGDDPDNFVLEACFVEEAEAIERLQALPWRFMREPIVAYLEARVPAGTIWLYRRDQRGGDELVSMVVGTGPPINRAASPSEAARGERAAPSFQASMFTLGCLGILLLLGVILVIGIISIAH